jgi:predicted nucleic acid-binding protein
MFLLDTNVISELQKSKTHGAVLAWFEVVMIAVTTRLHRSVVVTRDVNDLKRFDVEVSNPFVSARGE